MKSQYSLSERVVSRCGERFSSGSRLVLLVLLALVAVSAQAATRTSGTLGGGTRWATPFYVQDSGQPGPTVMIVGGVHGNEPSGVSSAEQVRHWPIVRGKVVVLPRANVAGIAANTRNIPSVEKAQANLNRNFPKSKGRAQAVGELATLIWDFTKKTKPDWLLDLHEGIDFHQINPKSVGSSVIVYASPAAEKKAVAVAEKMLSDVNATVTEEKKKLVLITSRGDKGYLSRAVASHLGAIALTLETTMKDQPLSKRDRQHRILVYRFLKEMRMLDPSVTPGWLTDHERSRQDTLAIALYDDRGTLGTGVPRLTRLFTRRPHTTLVHVGPPEMTTDILRQFDLVIFPGGSGSGESKAIGASGLDAVKRFVENGGGYMGICAGAYLATYNYSWSLKILDAKTVSSKWRRGKGMLKVEMTDRGCELLGPVEREISIRYHNGPIIAPAGAKDLPDYETLACFREEVTEGESPKGAMVNSPAIVAARCKEGRVICFSPHPEGSPNEAIVRRAAEWAAGAPREECVEGNEATSGKNHSRELQKLAPCHAGC